MVTIRPTGEVDVEYEELKRWIKDFLKLLDRRRSDRCALLHGADELIRKWHNTIVEITNTLTIEGPALSANILEFRKFVHSDNFEDTYRKTIPRIQDMYKKMLHEEINRPETPEGNATLESVQNVLDKLYEFSFDTLREKSELLDKLSQYEKPMDSALLNDWLSKVHERRIEVANALVIADGKLNCDREVLDNIFKDLGHKTGNFLDKLRQFTKRDTVYS